MKKQIRKTASDFAGILKELVLLLSFNFRTLILFVVIYSIISWIIVTVATYLLTTLSLKASGLIYLGNDNFVRYLQSPVTWITFCLCLVIVGTMQMVQIGGMIRIFYASGERKKVSVREAFYFGIESAAQLRNPKNWSIFLIMVLMLPYLGLFSLSNVSFSVAVPGFLREYLLTHRIWTIIYVASLITVFIFTISWMISLHIFTLEKKTFRESKHLSARVFRANYIQMIADAAAAAGIWIALFYVIGVLADLLTRAGATLIYGPENVMAITYARNIVQALVNVVNMFLTPSFTMAFLSVMFRRFEKETEQNTILARFEGKKYFFSKRSVVIFLCIFAGCCVIYADLFFTGRAMHNTDMHRPEIVAHKGDCVHAPENTLPAFQLAIDEGVSDWIELDVRQSADGEIVVCHDDNLKRFTGLNVSIHSMNYEDIRKLDAGAWFSKEYAGTHFCTLEEAIDLCKGKIRLQIEIKPTKYDKDFEKSIAELINKKGIKDECVVVSISSAALQRIREADPEITRVFALAAANGNIAKIPFADWLSVEESNITEEMTGSIHEEGKRVYAWTVNSASDAQRCIDYGIDGILTDDPVLMDRFLSTADYTGGLIKNIRSWTESTNFMLQFGF